MTHINKWFTYIIYKLKLDKIHKTVLNSNNSDKAFTFIHYKTKANASIF